MSITQNNIGDFITFLYRKRKQQEPPPQLIAGWEALKQEEIQTQLNGLFQSWGMGEEEKKLEINLFFKETLFGPKPVPVREPVNMVSAAEPGLWPEEGKTVVPKMKTRKGRLRWPVVLMVLAAIIAGYLGIQYIAFVNTGYVYTITDNVSVRNEAKEIVARMDLSEPVNVEIPSFQKLKAVDRKIYARSIDNTDKTYPCRKVLINKVSFFNYLFNRDKISGYVNTNYVVDNEREFNMYLRAFREVKNNKSENTALTAVYRKIIIGSMSKDASLEDMHIVLNTGNVARASLVNTYGIIRQTIKTNVQYVIIAGLSDGHYYRFEGDVRSNDFKDPIMVTVTHEDGTKEPLNGKFRFMNYDGGIALYDCERGMLTNYRAARDPEGKFGSFEYHAPTIIDHFIQPDSVLQEQE
jgi:hypothetical protein